MLSQRLAKSALAFSLSMFALVGGLGGALILSCASRGWHGIFLGEGGRAAEAAPTPQFAPALAEA